MAYYDFKKKPALTTKEGEKDVLYPSIVFNGTINTKQLLKQLVARTGYKPGVVEGTLMELVDLVGEYIGQGYRVEVGEFGYFSGKIKSRLVKDKKDLRSPSIQFNGVPKHSRRKQRVNWNGLKNYFSKLQANWMTKN